MAILFVVREKSSII